MRYATMILLVLSALSGAAAFAADSWPGFRGAGDSHATEHELPLVWSDNQNLAWTLDLPGYGQSSPVVWSDRAFATSVKGDNKETLDVTCLHVGNGAVEWQKELPASRTAKVTDYQSIAAPTPAVDAHRVYAFFESGDLIALTRAGEVAWTRTLCDDYGDFQGNHGLGSSLAQTDDAIILLIDHSGPSYLAAIDKSSGRTKWKQDRSPRVSWSSPVVAAGAAGLEILVSSNGVAQSYEAASGELLWEVTDLKGNTVASPSVTAHEVLIGSGDPGHSMLVRRNGRGNVGQSHVAWRTEDASTSFGSPLLHDGRAYFVNKAGVAFALSLATGQTLWTARLPDSTWASPVAAGDRVYFFCKNGATVVARSSDQFEKLAESSLTVQSRLYGVAVAGRGFLFRDGRRLLCVRE